MRAHYQNSSHRGADTAMATLPAVDNQLDDPRLALIQGELSLLFRRARVYFRSAAQDAHPELQMAAYALLAYLVDEGPLRASGLVDYFGTDKSAISRQLAQLESLGFVHRLPDPADGRAQLVEATEVGIERCQAARTKSALRMRDRLQHWDESEIAELGRLLAKFNQTMGDPG